MVLTAENYYSREANEEYMSVWDKLEKTPVRPSIQNRVSEVDNW